MTAAGGYIYLYLILYAKIIQANTSVTPLARLTGTSWLNSPKTNHINVPKANSEYIASDIPEVSFVLMVLIACGRKDTVVQNAASRPIASVIC